MAKTHLVSPADPALTRCNLEHAGAMWPRPLPVTDVLSSATCVRCLRAVQAAIAVGDEALPYVPPPAEPARYGARDLSRTGTQAIADSRRTQEPERRTWPTPEAAIRSYVRSRAEGAALRSTSDPARAQRVQDARDPSLGGREHAAVDRHRTVAVAITRAMDDPALLLICRLRPEDALEALVLVLVGQGVRVLVRAVGGETRKGRCLEWRGRLPEDVAREVSERTSVPLCDTQVTAIARHFVGHVRDALLASGELGARGERAPRVWDAAARIREVSDDERSVRRGDSRVDLGSVTR